MEKSRRFHKIIVEQGDENDKNWSCSAVDIKLDIKFLLKEYYSVFFDENGENLIVRFNNGQSFKISVEEI